MPIPPRRWFAFRLRTLFVPVAVLSLPLAWVTYSRNWIRDRRAMLEAHPAMVPVCWNECVPVRAPGALGLFGEAGFGGLILDIKTPNVPKKSDVARLFPEAEIVEEDFAETSSLTPSAALPQP